MDETKGTTWRIGLGMRCITPERPIWLYGYMSEKRFRPSIGVLDDLYARVIALEDEGGTRAVIAALDLCVPRKPLSQRIAKAIGEATGLPRDRILVNVSHTHSGPALDQADLAGRFPAEGEDLRAIEEYTAALPGIVADAAADATKSPAPARLSLGRGTAGFVANRRALDADGKWTGMRAYPEGRVDRAVPVLRIDSPAGELLALVFGCACHNVTLGPDNLLVSSDYAGFARAALERDHPGITAVYLAGCGADANPEPRSSARQWVDVRGHGEALASEITRVMQDERFNPVLGPLGTAMTTVDLPLVSDLSTDELTALSGGPDWMSYNAAQMLAATERGENLPESYPAPLSLWRFGESLDLVGISGEVCGGFAFHAEEVLSPHRVWALGYSHEVFGYLPTAKIIEEGGYETRGLVAPGLGYFAPEVEKTVVDAMARLGRAR